MELKIPVVIMVLIVATRHLVMAEIRNNDQNITRNSDIDHQNLLDRLDDLERKVAEQPSALGALQHEFKEETDNIRQSHADEMWNIKTELESIRQSHEGEISKLIVDLNNLRRSHADEMVSLKAELEVIRQSHADEIATINTDIGSIHQQHADAIASIKTGSKAETLILKQAHEECMCRNSPASGGDKNEMLEETNNSEDDDEEHNQEDDATNVKEQVERYDGSQIPTNRIRRVGSKKDVAFFATMEANQLHIGQLQNIKFTDVYTNIGNAYDTHQGVFKAPVPGIYVFYTKVVASPRDESEFGMFVNGHVIAKMYAQSSEDRYYGSGNALVLHLTQNDELSIKHMNIDHGVQGDHFSTFSGFLLSQDDQQTDVIVGK